MASGESRPTVIIIYEDDPRVRSRLSSEFPSLAPQAFLVPFYAIDGGTILFNGGLSRASVAADLAKDISARVVGYTLGDLDAAGLGTAVEIVRVPTAGGRT